MKIKEVTCKTALSKSNLPGLTYSLNPYRGCQHNCAYCYVPNVLRIKREEWGSFVNIKTNIPNVLSKELRNKKPGIVAISTVTDPYQPIEKKYNLTRYCLEQLLKYDFPVSIQTKSKLILKDLDMISKFSNAEVMISIGTLNDDERKLIEPYTSSINDRLEILKQFSKNGINTSVFFGPIYPTIKIENLNEIIDTFTNYGASEIMYDKLNKKPGIMNNIINKAPNWKILNYDEFDYTKIYKEIEKICTEKNIKVSSAF
jgi:DNA repair photolyase